MCRNKTAALFDHLVCGGEQLRRQGEAEHLGGLEVDDELELGGLLDGFGFAPRRMRSA